MRQDWFDIVPAPSQASRRGSPPLKVPFGLKAGRMWSPKQVPPGRDCGCVCPACSAPLVAKAADSTWRRPHFAHLAETDCRAGYETALHKKAKELLAEHAVVWLPAWDGEPDMPNPPTLADDEGQWITGTRMELPAREIRLHTVGLEEAQGDYTPDVIGTDDQGELLIEIRVSHAVDALKRRRIQSEGKRLIEIDLSELPPEALWEEERLIHHVLKDVSNRAWLSCPEATEAWRAAYRALKAEVAARNQVIALRKQAEEARHQALAKADADRQANRERFRAQERAKYQAELEALPGLVSVARIETLLEEYHDRDHREADLLIAQIPGERLQAAMRECEPNAWLYQVHPALWQAAMYHRFVLGQAMGRQFNQRDLARWVMQQFGREETLYTLFRAQYAFRSRVRNAGIHKRRISFWAFTELENRQIPDFYKPINTFVDRLVYLRALERVPELLGEVRIPDAI